MLEKYKVINSLESRYLRHDGDPLSVDGAEHSVLEEDGEVSLCRLLESEDGSSLEPGEEGTYLRRSFHVGKSRGTAPQVLHAVASHVECHLPDQSRERKFWNEKAGRLLILPNLPQGLHASPHRRLVPAGWWRLISLLGISLLPSTSPSTIFLLSLLVASQES